MLTTLELLRSHHYHYTAGNISMSFYMTHMFGVMAISIPQQVISAIDLEENSACNTYVTGEGSPAGPPGEPESCENLPLLDDPELSFRPGEFCVFSGELAMETDTCTPSLDPSRVCSVEDYQGCFMNFGVELPDAWEGTEAEYHLRQINIETVVAKKLK